MKKSHREAISRGVRAAKQSRVAASVMEVPQAVNDPLISSNDKAILAVAVLKGRDVITEDEAWDLIGKILGVPYPTVASGPRR